MTSPKETATSAPILCPQNYQSRFFTDPKEIERIFKLRGGIVDFIEKECGDDVRYAARVLIDCQLNGQKDLAKEIEEAMRKKWPQINWKAVEQMRKNTPG